MQAGPPPRGSRAVWVVSSLKLLPQKKEHPASNGASNEFDGNVHAPIDDLSDEDNSREGDEAEYLSSMALDDLSDRDGYMPVADPASDVDSPHSAHMAVDDVPDGDEPTSPVSSDGRVRRPTKVRPSLYKSQVELAAANREQ